MRDCTDVLEVVRALSRRGSRVYVYAGGCMSVLIDVRAQGFSRNVWH